MFGYVGVIFGIFGMGVKRSNVGSGGRRERPFGETERLVAFGSAVLDRVPCHVLLLVPSVLR